MPLYSTRFNDCEYNINESYAETGALAIICNNMAVEVV